MARYGIMIALLLSGHSAAYIACMCPGGLTWCNEWIGDPELEETIRWLSAFRSVDKTRNSATAEKTARQLCISARDRVFGLHFSI